MENLNNIEEYPNATEINLIDGGDLK